MSKNYTFDTAPSLSMSRSKITGLSHGVTTSVSMGRAYPIYCEEILPGDSFKVKTNMICRLTSQFIKPIYGNLFADISFFFVPWRLVCKDFAVIFGENKNGPWANETVPPKLTRTNQTVVSKSLGDYLELPVGVQIKAPVSVAYNRAVALIWNEWFRDENYQQPVRIEMGSASSNESFNGYEWSVNNYMGLCPPVSKYKDYFTSVLPEPQKGDAISLNDMMAPSRVYAGERHEHLNTQALTWDKLVTGTPLNDPSYLVAYAPSSSSNGISTMSQFDPDATGSAEIAPNNLYAEGLNITVNEMRLAFQAQKILERDALGTRYVEHILNTFGVTNPDSRLQRPELLNTYRMPINIQQVASTASEGSLASLGAYSLSNGNTGFTKSFSEYGCVIGFVTFRQYHSYQQGVPKRFMRTSRLDYYNPALAYIGMTPVKSAEIYGSAPEADIFGYQRAWSEYRHHQNVISGEMRSEATNSLDVWHIADDYANQPVASAEFMQETPKYLDRTIVVTSDVQDQFILDIWHDVEAVRVMPANPMPGLIDHY